MAAEQQSAMINKAYETLREPLQRAHLLVSVLVFWLLPCAQRC